MQFKDYYDILGITPDADFKAIKTAYRKLARQYHPDVSEEHDAEDRFKEITEAYEVLKDSTKRSEYDELCRHYDGRGNFEPPPGWTSNSAFHEGSDAPYASGFSEFFESVFSGRPSNGFAYHSRSARRGDDIEIDLPIFLEETMHEATKPVVYKLPQTQADGRITYTSKKLNVKIPAGTVDGERIRLPGQGTAGAGGASAGDMYLRIRLIPHPLFDVEGHDLILTVPLAPWEAALGTKLNVPTLTGEIVLTVPSGSQTGTRLRVTGKGLVGKQGIGDLYAILKVVMPDKSSDSINQQWRELAANFNYNPRAHWND